MVDPFSTFITLLPFFFVWAKGSVKSLCSDEKSLLLNRYSYHFSSRAHEQTLNWTPVCSASGSQKTRQIGMSHPELPPSSLSHQFCVPSCHSATLLSHHSDKILSWLWFCVYMRKFLKIRADTAMMEIIWSELHLVLCGWVSAQESPLSFGVDPDKGADPRMFSHFLYHCKSFTTFSSISQVIIPGSWLKQSGIFGCLVSMRGYKRGLWGSGRGTEVIPILLCHFTL